MGTDNRHGVGFRFRPSDEEIVSYFLRHKVAGRHHLTSNIAEIDLCQCEPWELPGRSAIQSDDQVWYFFCRQDRKYSRGRRANRTTKEGYWKKTGEDRKVRARGSNLDIGTKKTLVFYKGRIRTGARTGWVMHEYRLTSTANSPNSAPKELVLCKLMKNEDARVHVKNKEKLRQALSLCFLVQEILWTLLSQRVPEESSLEAILIIHVLEFMRMLQINIPLFMAPFSGMI